jgi:hypothetical protein
MGKIVRVISAWFRDFLHAPRLIDQYRAITDSTQEVKVDPFGGFSRNHKEL